jgi:hypothetical protein
MIDGIKAVGYLYQLFLFGADLRFLNFYIIPASQPAQGFYIAQLLMLHHKCDRVAAFTTPKTFEYLFRGRNRKRRRLFIVKRAKPEVIGTSFLQLHKFPHHINDVDAVRDLLYGIRRNQGKQKYEVRATKYEVEQKIPRSL